MQLIIADLNEMWNSVCTSTTCVMYMNTPAMSTSCSLAQ